MKHIYQTFGCIAWLALAGSVWAQDAAPASPAKAEDEEEVKPLKLNSITIGINSWQPSGRQSRFNEFATPPRGWNIVGLKYLSPFNGGTGLGLNYSGWPSGDFYGDGVGYFSQGATTVRFSNYAFNSTSNVLSTVDESQDRRMTFSLEQAINPNLSAALLYRSDERDFQREAPLESPHNRTRMYGLTLGGRWGGMSYGFTGTEKRTFTDVGSQPTTLTREAAFTAGTDVGPNANIEATASAAQIEKQGVAGKANVKSLAAVGSFFLSPTITLSLNASNEEFDLGDFVDGGYARRRVSTGARLQYRHKRLNLQAAYRHREVERVRGDRRAVDVPSWDSVDVRLFKRLKSGFRVTFRGTLDDLNDSAVAVTEIPEQLWWSRKTMAQVKVDRGGEKLNGYAAYTYRFRQNRQRGVEIRNSSIALGASTILSPKALAYAEYAFDSSSAKSGDDDGDIALRHYFPKSNTMALGVDCTLSAADSLAASLLLFRTNNLKGSHLNVSYRHQYSPDSALEVSVAPMVFSDLAFNVTGARATVASLRYSVKF